MSTRKILALFGAVLMALSLAGCGGDESDPSGEPLASLEITSNDLEEGTLYVTKGTGVFVGVVGRHGDGSPAGEARVAASEWSTDGPETLRVHSLDGSGVVEGRKDWFDTVVAPVAEVPDAGTPMPPPEPYVPAATLTVTLDDVSDSVNVQIVLNAGGSWLATLDDGAPLPLDLTQNGRTVTHEATGASGSVEGNGFTLSFAGYSLIGTFIERDRVEGTLVDPTGKPGTWSATRTK